jgi:hypothetical protein
MGGWWRGEGYVLRCGAFGARVFAMGDILLAVL